MSRNDLFSESLVSHNSEKPVKQCRRTGRCTEQKWDYGTLESRGVCNDKGVLVRWKGHNVLIFLVVNQLHQSVENRTSWCCRSIWTIISIFLWWKCYHRVGWIREWLKLVQHLTDLDDWTSLIVEGRDPHRDLLRGRQIQFDFGLRYKKLKIEKDE